MKRRHFVAGTGLAAAASATVLPARAQAGSLRIGLLTTLSGPSAGLGRDTVDGFNLGIRHAGGRLGGLATEVISADDQLKPDVGKATAERMVQRDRVDIMTGVVFSNVMLAISDTVLKDRRGVFYLSSNAGPSELAGRDCHPNFFSVSWQNDNTHEAMGEHMTKAGIKRAYLLAPNYPAGKDALTGFKRFFKGEIVAEVYTQIGQTDYAAELAALRAARPEATYFFYPGGMGIAFVRQYTAAGLAQQVPVFGPSFSLDQTILPAIGDAALGLYASTFWSEKLENPANAKFVADFEAAHNRIPSPYAAQAYDAAQLIDAALKQAGGIADKAKFRNALRAANFSSVRGPFRFNANHFPIQNYYLTQIQKDARGRLVNELRGVIFSSHADAYSGQCRMKP
ncbi:MAG: ABC transporter substrate-binding protein [Alphaproteobacteria bacterium]|nr:ABC transporter substrate-binding protein [Alphaproteobacteria bacterium]MBM3628638.1 ABC transporter substrate-binding protein [Alphaproteobacteria bacterium]